MIRTVLTLRAIAIAGPSPRIGDLMASVNGKALYRIATVTRLRVAGSNRLCFRLTCERLQGSNAPAGAIIHPWRYNRRSAKNQTPRLEPQQPRERFRAAPVPRNAAAASEHARTARIGQERHTGVDLGPALRRRGVRDRRGIVLREPDVLIDDSAVDPAHPSRRLRRAYRLDPVDVLRRAGSIGPRAVDAADELRQYLEHSVPAIGGGLSARSGNQPFGYQPITDVHIRASSKLRAASAALGDLLWSPVLWICLGGTVQGYAAHWHMRASTASALVESGMERLAEHFYGKAA